MKPRLLFILSKDCQAFITKLYHIDDQYSAMTDQWFGDMNNIPYVMHLRKWSFETYDCSLLIASGNNSLLNAYGNNYSSAYYLNGIDTFDQLGVALHKWKESEVKMLRMCRYRNQLYVERDGGITWGWFDTFNNAMQFLLKHANEYQLSCYYDDEDHLMITDSDWAIARLCM